MQMQTQMQMTIVPTNNEWDAPVTVYRYPDSTAISRDDKPMYGWLNRTLFPHAIFVIDGKMSEFDAARQPETH